MNIEQEKQSIEEELQKLDERINAICRQVIETICKKKKWNFVSYWSTYFYVIKNGKKQEIIDDPTEFTTIFNWAEDLRAFPIMLYEDGEWKA